ncbi:site-specific DNA-methyltransferase [Streptomyces avermitilis]|uniref:site-specific DNA-methyltransferase n=1 Tax=Streptomyces avermitilis TaxID=33903 RepID=UPI0037237E10
MAHIDNLISAVKDPQLREALRIEYEKIAQTRKFGLVFDRHQPESVLLPSFSVRPGDKVRVLQEGVQDRTAVDETGVWTVVSIARSDVQLRDAEGNLRNEQLARLVVTREFGDSIYPGLKSMGRVLRGGGTDGDAGDKPFHAVVNAENYHALQALLYPYEGRVDAIYIDPPYNTGSRDWKYNNNYVDDNDPYRHSKWLSFMEKRLELAKRLLNPASSVLVVTIDEKEVHRLGLLIEQVFPGRRMQMVTIAINHRGVARLKEFTRVEEYAFFVFIGEAGPSLTSDDLLTAESEEEKGGEVVRWERLTKGSNNALRTDRPNLFYPVYVDPERGRIAKVGDPVPLNVDRTSVPEEPGLVAVWPLSMTGVEKRWQCSADTFRSFVDQGIAKVGSYDRKNDRWSILYLNRGQRERIERGEIRVTGRDANGVLELEMNERPLRAAMTIWNRSSHNAGYYGSGVLSALLPDRKFPFPKSLYAVEDSLRLAVGDKPDALVIDFFAGSGTTAHALARLNREDDGRRRSILVTNNEVSVAEAKALREQGLSPGDPAWEDLGICRYITIPRMRAAVTGISSTGNPLKGEYKFGQAFPMSDGLDENIEFFDLTYEDASMVSLGRRFEAIAPLLWMKAGAKGERIDKISDQGWEVLDDANYGVLFDTSSWPGFVEAVTKRKSEALRLSHLFIVTDSLVEFQQIAGRIDQGIELVRLYADYLRTFEINTPRRNRSGGDGWRRTAVPRQRDNEQASVS